MTLPTRRHLLGAGLALPLLAASGCSTSRIDDYVGEKPELDLRTYFNGRLDAYGIFTDRTNRVVKRFIVVMNCEWKGDEGVLDEDFIYSDGSTQKRIWRLRHLGNGRYTGTAEDVVGEASGQTRGNAFNWRYTMMLPLDGKVWHVELDDWMYLMDDKVMINKAVMSKFGLRLGEVTLTFVKP
jgi:hypothetical protein